MVGRFGLPSCVLMIPMKSKTVVAFVIVLMCFIPQAHSNEEGGGKLLDTKFFAEKLVDDYGSDGYISVKQLEGLISTIKKQLGNNGGLDTHKDNGHSETNGQEYSVDNGEKHVTSDSSDCRDATESEKCASETCLTASDIFKVHSLGENASVDVAKFEDMSPTVLYQLQNPSCHEDVNHSKRQHVKPPAVQVWGFGFLCVTLINLCAVIGMVFLPLMKKSFYTRLLMFMVALAVGTLAGSSLLFLIPECFGMTHENSPLLNEYIWKSTAIIGGVYLFFLTERFLKMVISYRRKRKHEKKPSDIMSSIHNTRHRHESMNMSFEPPSKDIQLSDGGNLLSCGSGNTDEDNISVKSPGNGAAAGHGHGHDIKSVAWMIIFGDGLHNFIDGLSIGAAFAGNIMTGISVSVAVICEELPHELGDFAILLNSGMSMKQALGYNFLSACMCYLGLVIGILIGEMTSGAEWIFAIAGGMFLYISLVDMLPEVNHVAEVEEEENGRQCSVFLIQNFGLLAGYGIMLILAYYGGEIDFTT